MSMNPKENLLRAIAHDHPVRIPYGGRLNTAEGMQVVDYEGALPPANGVDTWGVEWATTEQELIPYIVGHPVDSLRELLEYPFPDPRAPGLFDSAREKMDKAHYLVIGRHIDLPFTRYWTLWGMDNGLMAMVTHPDEVMGFLHRLADWNNAIADGYLGIGVEAARLSADYGTQRSLLMSPALWRAMIKPALAKIVGHYKRAGVLVFLHSCGCIESIMDDLVEIGVDVFNIQSNANDLLAMKRRFGDSITFQGGVASATLGTGTQEDARQATLKAIRDLGPGGGLILEPDQQMVIPEENIKVLVETARRCGRYPLATALDRATTVLRN